MTATNNSTVILCCCSTVPCSMALSKTRWPQQSLAMGRTWPSTSSPRALGEVSTDRARHATGYAKGSREKSTMRPLTARSAASRSPPPDANFTINPEHVELKFEEEAVVLAEECSHSRVVRVVHASSVNKALRSTARCLLCRRRVTRARRRRHTARTTLTSCVDSAAPTRDIGKGVARVW
eukprot:CAMPEP_0194486956 /NCGR_PEP_ID=MMETSP0253-20130528/7416_1 /TAXON_ID=2966 /ORGANISM="Noctiluca scintillans" /LENGTH=179 /DNA_ID=CAMNT_0039327111 /DNA_START=992 /DNA_END=1528 /DNA_ORIENTATION=+